MYTMLIVLIL